MNINDMFPSNWLKADDLPEDDDLQVTIKSIVTEEVGQGTERETKAVVYFRETDKGLVLNKTNAGTIAQIHGTDTDDWEGKKIALFAQEVDFRGKQVLAIRVRLKKPKPAAGREPVAAAAGKASGAWKEEDD